MTQNETWRQAAPTKAFALWHHGKWYGEGDTAAAAWSDARATIAPASPKFWRELRDNGKARATLAVDPLTVQRIEQMTFPRDSSGAVWR
jgi:hypothetical protein